jgi:hypothetical protein
MIEVGMPRTIFSLKRRVQTSLILGLMLAGAGPGRSQEGAKSMSGMNMGNMPMGNGNGMSGMGGMAGMSIGDTAMGTMGFMGVMGSRPEPGLLMKLVCGYDISMANMSPMNGMTAGGMESMPGMKMDRGDAKSVLAERAKLSPADRQLVDAQEWCPITKMRLGSMGPPIKIVLKGQPVFLCCADCPEAARADPDKTLAEVAKLRERKARGASTDEIGSMAGMSMDNMSMDNMGAMRGMNGRRFTISGWTDMSYTASSASQSNLPMAFNYKANEYLLQQSWLRIDYAVDEKSASPSFGFRSDWILPGSDYLFTLPRGLWNSQLTANNGGPNTYGIDPFQFYGETYLPGILQGLDIKVGRFCMLQGVEMTEATMNLLLSHSYTFLVDPFTHTGILTTTRVSDQLVMQAGITTGSDVFFGPAARATFVGGVNWTSASKNTNLGFFTVLGAGRFDDANTFDNRNLFDFVWHQKLGSRLYYTLDALFGYEYNAPGMGTADWYGVVQYLTYEWTPKLAPTARLEFFDDVRGERTGFAGLYTALTAGVNYQPKTWLTLRPEIRYDNSQGGAFEGKHGLFTATADVIFRW